MEGEQTETSESLAILVGTMKAKIEVLESTNAEMKARIDDIEQRDHWTEDDIRRLWNSIHETQQAVTEVAEELEEATEPTTPLEQTEQVAESVQEQVFDASTIEEKPTTKRKWRLTF